MDISAALLTALKNYNVCMHSVVYVPVWFKLVVERGTIGTNFVSILNDLDLYSRSQDYEKARMSAPIISQSSRMIIVEYGMILRFVSVMHLSSVLSCLINFKRKNLTHVISVKTLRSFVFGHLPADFFQP